MAGPKAPAPAPGPTRQRGGPAPRLDPGATPDTRTGQRPTLRPSVRVMWQDNDRWPNGLKAMPGDLARRWLKATARAGEVCLRILVVAMYVSPNRQKA